MTASRSFDLAALAMAIERARTQSETSWADLGRQVGVSVSTMKRYARASDAEADGVLALVGWLDVAPEEFIPGSAVVGERLAPAGRGMLRADLEAQG